MLANTESPAISFPLKPSALPVEREKQNDSCKKNFQFSKPSEKLISQMNIEDFLNELRNSQKWNEEWKESIIALLPHLNTRGYLNFGEALAGFHGKAQVLQRTTPSGSPSLPDLDQDVLSAFINAGQDLLPQFDKTQLMHIVALGLFLGAGPTEDFIQTWRLTADKKRKEFSREERDYLRSVFRRWGVPPRKINEATQNENENGAPIP